VISIIDRVVGKRCPTCGALVTRYADLDGLGGWFGCECSGNPAAWPDVWTFEAEVADDVGNVTMKSHEFPTREAAEAWAKANEEMIAHMGE